MLSCEFKSLLTVISLGDRVLDHLSLYRDLALQLAELVLLALHCGL